MQENNVPQEKEEQPILCLIQDIKDGRVLPETLTKDLRQCCVEVLLGEGYTVAAMARVFRRSDKTIRRDLEAIRERNAIIPDLSLATKIIGEMMMYARIHRDQLMKLARNREASVSEKAQAEYLSFKVFSELITKMQSLGYLPSKPQQVVGEIFHHVDGQVNDFEELSREILEIEEMANENNDVKEDVRKMKMVLDNLCNGEIKKEKGNNNEGKKQ